MVVRGGQARAPDGKRSKSVAGGMSHDRYYSQAIQDPSTRTPRNSISHSLVLRDDMLALQDFQCYDVGRGDHAVIVYLARGKLCMMVFPLPCNASAYICVSQLSHSLFILNGQAIILERITGGDC